jgi:hypothetical protein
MTWSQPISAMVRDEFATARKRHRGVTDRPDLSTDPTTMRPAYTDGPIANRIQIPTEPRPEFTEEDRLRVHSDIPTIIHRKKEETVETLTIANAVENMTKTRQFLLAKRAELQAQLAEIDRALGSEAPIPLIPVAPKTAVPGPKRGSKPNGITAEIRGLLAHGQMTLSELRAATGRTTTGLNVLYQMRRQGEVSYNKETRAFSLAS